MPQAERTIVIACPQAEVYAFSANAENDTRWRPLAAELTGIKKFVMATPVQKSMDAEMANLD